MAAETVRATVPMPRGFRAADADTIQFPAVNPPTLKHPKIDDRVRIPRQRPASDGADRAELDAALFLAESQQVITGWAEKVGTRLARLLDDDRLSESERNDVRQSIRLVTTNEANQRVADEILKIGRDEAMDVSAKVRRIGVVLRSRFKEPCPAFCDGNHDDENPAADIRAHVRLVGEVSSGPIRDYDRSVIRVTVERMDTFGVPGDPVVRVDLVEGDWVLCSPRAVFRLGRLLVKARQVLRQARRAGV